MKRKFLWISIVVSCITALMAGIIFAAKWMSGSSDGTVHVGNLAKQQALATGDPLTVTTPYFHAVLPAGYSVKRQVDTPSGNPVLLQFMATAPTATDQQVAITIGTMPSAGLDDLSGYHMRAGNTAAYAKTTLPNQPSGAVAFVSTSGPTNYAIYWPHSGRYAEIGISTDGVATPGQLQTVFSQTIQYWEWL